MERKTTKAAARCGHSITSGRGGFPSIRACGARAVEGGTRCRRHGGAPAAAQPAATRPAVERSSDEVERLADSFMRDRLEDATGLAWGAFAARRGTSYLSASILDRLIYATDGADQIPVAGGPLTIEVVYRGEVTLHVGSTRAEDAIHDLLHHLFPDLC